MKRFIYIILFMLTAISSGCSIKEDREDCDNAYVFFRYFGDGTRDIFPEKIGKVDMFIYRDGQLVESMALNADYLKNNDRVRLSLPSGQYDVVCWGNAHNASSIGDTDAFGSARIRPKSAAGNGVVQSTDSIYMGSKSIRVKQDKLSRDTVDFAGAHIKLHMKVSGFSDGNARADAGNAAGEGVGRTDTGSAATRANATAVAARVHKTHAAFDFEMNPTGEYISCAPAFTAKDDYYVSRLNVFRFEDGNDVEIELYDTSTGDILHTLRMEDFMRDNGISVTGRHEVTIGVHFFKAPTVISVMPWEASDIFPDW